MFNRDGPVSDCHKVFKGSLATGYLALKRRHSFPLLSLLYHHVIVFSFGFGISWLFWYFLWQTTVSILLFTLAVALVDIQIPYPVVHRIIPCRRRLDRSTSDHDALEQPVVPSTIQGNSAVNKRNARSSGLRSGSYSPVRNNGTAAIITIPDDAHKEEGAFSQKSFPGCRIEWSTRIIPSSSFSIRWFHLDVLVWRWFSTSWEFQTLRYVTLLDALAVVVYLIVDSVIDIDGSNFLKSGRSIDVILPVMLGCITTSVIQIFVFLKWMYRDVIFQPSITHEHRLEMRASHMAFYPNEELALKSNRKLCPNIFSLLSVDQLPRSVELATMNECVWYFKTYPCFSCIPSTAHMGNFPLTIATSDGDMTSWRRIYRPDHCELITNHAAKEDAGVSTEMGVGTETGVGTKTGVGTDANAHNYIYEKINPPVYRNFIYPFRCNPPFIDGLHLPLSRGRDVPVGCYLSYFNLPWPTSGCSISLLLHGCGPSVFVFLNGCYVGYSTDGFITAEFDVSRFLSEEPKNYLGGRFSNCLMLFCPKFSAASYLEDQDHWRLSGCFRDIELIRWASPKSSELMKIPDLWVEDFFSSAQPLGRLTRGTAE